MTALPTADIVADVTTEATSPVTHGAHGGCQRSAAFVVSHCGIALEHTGRVGVGASPSEPCLACLDIATCAICGASVVPLRVLLGL